MASQREPYLTVAGTWPFSFSAVDYASRKILRGESAVDAVEGGINLLEEDPSFGCYHVGYGGYPNSRGDVELDAAMMLGKGCQFGGVASVKKVKYPISLARRVLHDSPHNLLVGDGAQEFAMVNKLSLVSENEIQQRLPAQSQMSRLAPEGHDTLALVAMDKNKNIAAGVTTSGKKYKAPGRVGDSPLPGGGLYADNDVVMDSLSKSPVAQQVENLPGKHKAEGSGPKWCKFYSSALATGDGDEILKFCPTFHVVHLMSQGHKPNHACEEVIRTIARKIAPKKMFELGLIAIDKNGAIGAATSISEWTDCKTGQSYPGFPIVVWNPTNSSEVLLDVIAPLCL